MGEQGHAVLCVQEAAVVRWSVVLMERYKTSLFLTARGLICNSGWAADTVEGNIKSLRRGCGGEKDSMFPSLLTRTVWKLHITIYSLSCLIILHLSPSLCPLYPNPSTPRPTLISILGFVSYSIHLSITPPSLPPSLPPDAVAQGDRWSWISVICFIWYLSHCRPQRLGLKWARSWRFS